MFHPWNDWAVVRGSFKCKLCLVPMWQNDLAGGSLPKSGQCGARRVAVLQYDRMTFNKIFQLSISCFASFLVFACWGITQSVFCLCVPPSELQMSPFHWCIEAFFSSVAPGASQWGWGPLMDCSVCLWATCSSAKSPHSKAFWLNRLHGCFQADGNKNSHYGPRRPVITYSVTDL